MDSSIIEIFEEAITVKLRLKKCDVLLLCVIYRNPSSSDTNNTHLLEFLDFINKDNSSHKLLIGDFNLPNIEWFNLSLKSKANTINIESRFLDKLQNLYWIQHVVNPTRARGMDKPSLHDLVTDHDVLQIKYTCYATINSTEKTVYLYDKCNFEAMKDYLDINWEERMKNHKDIQEQWNMFTEWLEIANAMFVPSKKVPIHTSSQKYIPTDTNTVRMIHQKHRAWTRYIETIDQHKYDYYVSLRNRVRALTRKARIQKEKEVSHVIKTNKKKFWKYINGRTKTKCSIPDLEITRNGAIEVVSSDREKAGSFLDFFTSVFTIEPTDCLPIMGPPIINEELSTVSFNVSDIATKLSKLNTDKSPGPDQIHPRVLKEIPIVAAPLKTMFTNSISSQKLPYQWKLVNVTPIHKKGKRKLCNNYRPISLTSVVVKILESFVR